LSILTKYFLALFAFQSWGNVESKIPFSSYLLLWLILYSYFLCDGIFTFSTFDLSLSGDPKPKQCVRRFFWKKTNVRKGRVAFLSNCRKCYFISNLHNWFKLFVYTQKHFFVEVCINDYVIM
jgi:hypothetical protein